MNKTENFIFKKINDIVSSQEYDIEDVIQAVIEEISDQNTYFNIHCAVDSDVSDNNSIESVRDCVEEFINEDMCEFLSTIDENVDDYIDCIRDFTNDNINYFSDLNRSLDYYGERQKKEWQDEINELERGYWNSRL